MWPAMTLWLVLLALTAAAEQPQATPAGQTPAEKIHVVADRLVAEPDSNTAEFIGNVKVTQGDTEIISDRLKIFYQSGGDKSDSQGDAGPGKSGRAARANGHAKCRA